MNSKKIKTIFSFLAILSLFFIPQLINSRYYMRIINIAGIFAIIIIGFNILYGLTGQVSFGQAGFYAIGAYAVGITTVQFGLPVWVGFFIAIISSLLAGIVIGVPTLRLKGHYLTFTTIAFGEIIRIVILNWKSFTRGYDGILGIPPISIGTWVFSNDYSIYYLILVVVILSVVFGERVKRSTYGRAMLAIRDSEIAAEVVGVNITKVKILSFVISAVFAGIAGAFYSHLLGYISPDAFDFKVSVSIVAMLLVGGVGSSVGAVIGAVLLTFLPELLRVSNEYYMVIYGIIFLVVLVYIPGGMISVYNKGIDFLKGFLMKVHGRKKS